MCVMFPVLDTGPWREGAFLTPPAFQVVNLHPHPRPLSVCLALRAAVLSEC